LGKRERKVVEGYIKEFYDEIIHTKSFLRMVNGSCDPIN